MSSLLRPVQCLEIRIIRRHGTLPRKEVAEQGQPATSDPTRSPVRSSDTIWATRRSRTRRENGSSKGRKKKKKEKKRNFVYLRSLCWRPNGVESKRINHHEGTNPRPVLGWSLRKTVCDSRHSESGAAGPAPFPDDAVDDGGKKTGRTRCKETPSFSGTASPRSVFRSDGDRRGL